MFRNKIINVEGKDYCSQKCADLMEQKEVKLNKPVVGNVYVEPSSGFNWEDYLANSITEFTVAPGHYFKQV